MEYSAKSDIGKHREKNEDSYYSRDSLFIVADGMGGHAAGEIASKTAVDSFLKHFNYLINKKINKNTDAEYIKEVMISSVKHANHEVYDFASLNSEYNGMGTTFTACFMMQNRAFIAHVGDSRLYLARENGLKLMTEDQTVVGEMYRNGLITYDEMFDHPLKNYLNNVLGTDSELDIDFLTMDVIKGDIVVICSDGLNSMLRDPEIAEIIQNSNEPAIITPDLIKNANKKGGIDNITVITIKL